jgi:hypothetical protein
MNRTVKDATLKVFPYDDIQGPKAHVTAFVHRLQFLQTPQGHPVANPIPGLQCLDQ